MARVGDGRRATLEEVAREAKVSRGRGHGAPSSGSR